MKRLLHGGDTSPYVRVIRILLHEKELDFERDVTPARERDNTELSALNPTLRVPIFQDGDNTKERVTLFETRIIAEYLLAAYPDTPSNVPGRALALTLTRPSSHFEDAMVLATVAAMLDSLVVLFQMGQGGVKREDVPFLQRTQLRVETSLDWLNAKAVPEGFLPGIFSVQDIFALCALDFAEARDIVLWRGRPKLEALHGALQGRTSVVETRSK